MNLPLSCLQIIIQCWKVNNRLFDTKVCIGFIEYISGIGFEEPYSKVDGLTFPMENLGLVFGGWADGDSLVDLGVGRFGFGVRAFDEANVGRFQGAGGGGNVFLSDGNVLVFVWVADACVGGTWRFFSGGG